MLHRPRSQLCDTQVAENIDSLQWHHMEWIPAVWDQLKWMVQEWIYFRMQLVGYTVLFELRVKLVATGPHGKWFKVLYFYSMTVSDCFRRFQSTSEFFRVLQTFSEYFRVLQTFSEYCTVFQSTVSEYTRFMLLLWRFSGFFRVFQSTDRNFRVKFRVLQKVSECFRVFKSKTLWKALKYSEIYSPKHAHEIL